MEEAIQKAIEGGWNPTEEKDYAINNEPNGVLTCHWYDQEYPEEGTNQYSMHEIILDPLFWQCLGKSLGWKRKVVGVFETQKDYQEGWLYHWHRFIDWISEGKDIDTFFNDLLAKGRE